MIQWHVNTPIAFFIFNRPDTTARVFEAIRQAQPSKLLVVADGPRSTRTGEAEKCSATRAIIDQVDWKCEVLTNYSDVNLGCRYRVSSGLDWVFEKVEEAIILEDDCLPHPTFFRFCEELLEWYRHDHRIVAISGDNFQNGHQPVEFSYYFSRYVHIWGWATWRRVWKLYDLDMQQWPLEKNRNWLNDILDSPQAIQYWSTIFQHAYEGFNTWDFSLVFACWLNRGLTILPTVNLVSNIGFGEDATHTKSRNKLTELPTHLMQFPLVRPRVVSRNILADNFTENQQFSGEPIIHLPADSQRLMNIDTCKVCHSTAQYFGRAKLLEKYDVDYFQCSHCGFVQTEEPYWLDEAYSQAIAPSDVGLVTRNLMFSKISGNLLMACFDSDAKFLDYGGGYGLFVRLMRDLGFDFYWYDKFAENIFARDLEAKKSNQTSYELVTAFELFEHFINPIDAIQEILKFSKNILFSTELLPANSPKPDEWWYYATHEGQHVSIYTPQALSIVAQKLNLNLYSNGSSLHLLTEKQLSPQQFQEIVCSEPQRFYKPSLVTQDFQAAISAIKAYRQTNTIQSDRMSIHSDSPQDTIKIIVDGTFFQLYKTGIYRLWKSLLEAWSQTDFAQQILLLDRNGTAPKITGIKYLCIPAYDYKKTDADRQMLQTICDREKADIFISTYYTTPVTTPSVFMAYDMIPEIAGYDPNNSMWREKRYGIGHASAFISISENTAKDLVRFYPEISPNEIAVAHCGVSSSFYPAPPAEVANFKANYGITKSYFLLSGMRVGYKNAMLFFKAYAQLANKHEFEIVCTGGGNQLEPEFSPYIAGSKIHLLQLSDDELRAAYSGATALVFPSQYEGFGLPVLEAMTCGCPVITSPTSSLPEVGGNAVLYVNPQEVNELVTALQTVQKNDDRQRLIAAGLEQSKKFSWAKMAQNVQEVLLYHAQNPQPKSQAAIAPSSTSILTAVDRYQQHPTDPPTIEQLRQVRQQLANYWLNLPAEQLETAYTGDAGKTHQALWNSGFKHEEIAEIDRALIQQIATNLAPGFDAPNAIQAFLAAALYSYPHQLAIKYQRAPIPNWLIPTYFQFMFESPRLFKEVGEVDRYFDYLSGWIGYLHSNITSNPNSDVWKYVTKIFAQSANLTPLYFSDRTQKLVQTQRAEILEFFLTQLGCQLNYTFPDRPADRPRIRLGIVVQSFSLTAEASTVVPVFEQIDRDRFEVYLYTIDAGNSDGFVRNLGDKFTVLSGQDLLTMVQTVRSDDLDILLIGSNITARSYPLTLLCLHRLARVQTTSLAAPVTTGMSQIDYYIAGTLTTPANAEAQYREKLVTVQGSGLCFRPLPEAPATIFPDRSSWGATADTIVFISGSNFRKINPEVRETWAKILAAVPNSILVLYPFGPNWGRHPQLEKPFFHQMHAVLAQHDVNPQRLILIKTLPSPADIRQCLTQADIYLDSYPYSGAASILDPLRMNLPAVAMAGEELRHCQSAAILQELQLRELVVRSEAEYIQLAVALATNPQLRQEGRSIIAQRMQSNPGFLDSRTYAANMGSLFRSLFEAEKHPSSAVSSLSVTQQSPIQITSYQQIQTAVEAIGGYPIPGQEAYLFNKVKSLSDNAIIVEIGSFQGRSTAAMAYACVGTQRKIYCIDAWDFEQEELKHVFEVWQNNIRHNGLEGYATPLKGYSRDILSRWNELTGGKAIDFIFIDGGHEYEDVLPDFQLAFPLVKSEGWIAFHDFGCDYPGVDRVWHELAKLNLTDYEYCSTIACGKKLAALGALPQLQKPSSGLSSQVLNRLIGCVNLYEIDPANASIVTELHPLRQQLAQQLLDVPTEELATLYQGEDGKAYKALLKSGFQKESIDATTQAFVQQLTQQGAGLVAPKALNAFMGAMLYYVPGTMQVKDAQTRLPGWLLPDYAQVFETALPAEQQGVEVELALPIEFLNRLLGCANLYYIDPTEPSIVAELHELRRQLAQFWLDLPPENLESVYKTEVGKRYTAMLESGFQKEIVLDRDRPFLQELTKLAADSTRLQSLNAMLGAMLYYAPGTMKVQNARTRLPGWLIADYERVFEGVGSLS
jgi:predicted O-linked N-acetylglucosamine transferase (SPINDLY family)/glycosyltransferase involved in cell wall biosynthesis/predicted O-methyltransferase YrrM